MSSLNSLRKFVCLFVCVYCCLPNLLLFSSIGALSKLVQLDVGGNEIEYLVCTLIRPIASSVLTPSPPPPSPLTSDSCPCCRSSGWTPTTSRICHPRYHTSPDWSVSTCLKIDWTLSQRISTYCRTWQTCISPRTASSGYPRE